MSVFEQGLHQEAVQVRVVDESTEELAPSCVRADSSRAAKSPVAQAGRSRARPNAERPSCSDRLESAAKGAGAPSLELRQIRPRAASDSTFVAPNIGLSSARTLGATARRF